MSPPGALEAVSARVKPQNHRSCRAESESLLLYLGGGQLVAALPVGSLRVAVDQHPLELELEERLDLLLQVRCSGDESQF